MDKPHKAHQKPSAGGKAAKKDAAKGIDRSGGQTYNPKVSLSCRTPQIILKILTIRHSPMRPSARLTKPHAELRRKTRSDCMCLTSIENRMSERSPARRARGWMKGDYRRRPLLSVSAARPVAANPPCSARASGVSPSTTSMSRKGLSRSSRARQGESLLWSAETT